jgi:signal transduction histidine kinase
MDALLKRPLAAPPAAVDGAITALIAVMTGAFFQEVAFLQGIPRWAGVVVAAVGVLPAAWRRRWPRAVLAVTAVSWAVAAALSPSPAPALAVAFCIYLIPLRFRLRDALGMLAGTLLVLAAGLAVFAVSRHGVYRPGGASQAAALLLESGLLVAIAWMIGYTVRQQRAYLAGRREQAEERARAQLAEARWAGTEERLRIAREVHDVVAHTMSVIAVQAGVAGYVGRTDPGEALRALSSIEETSRGALREMRALLAVLRAEGEQPAASPRDGGLGPAPGLADLGALAARTAEAGLRVDTDVRGEPRRLPAGLDLAAYRVIQEAVTNVIKHGATDRCTVTIEYREDWLTLAIADDGAGRAAGSPGAGPDGGPARRPAAGHGLAGMRERVGMYGGEFRAGPRPGRGFQVTPASR